MGDISMKLKWSGWLQYAVALPVTFLLLLVAALGSCLCHGDWSRRILVDTPLYFSSVLLLVTAFDLITVKFGLHRSEEMSVKEARCKDTFDLIRSRKSCRSFQSRRMAKEHREELMATCNRITGGEGTYTKPQLGNSKIRFEYVNAPLTVWPVVGAQEFLVAVAPKEYNRLAVIDVGRALEKVVLHATRMGLATCWIGPGADQQSVIGHLGKRFNPEEDQIIVVCAVGYPSWYKPHFLHVVMKSMARRLPLHSLFFANKEFGQPLDVNATLFRDFGRCYEICQWSPSSKNEQPVRCVGTIAGRTEGGRSRANSARLLPRFDFYATTNSRYYVPLAVGIWMTHWEMGCEALGIKGHYEVQQKEDGDGGNGKESKDGNSIDLPRYDVSWVTESMNGGHRTNQVSKESMQC